MTLTTLPRSELAPGLSGYAAGAGPTLILIHGVGLRAEAWQGVLPCLERKFSVLVPDLPGHGDSARASRAVLSAYCDPIARLLDAGPACVAGHSMGAMIAIEMAAARPTEVHAVAALNAVFQRSQAAATAVRARAAALRRDDVADPAATLARWFGAQPSGANQCAAETCRTWLTGCDPAGYADAYHVFAHHDGPHPDTLAALPMPALFLTGADEPNSTPAMSRAMAALALHGRAAIIPGAAHMAPLTHPEAVAHELLAQFAPHQP